MLCKNTEMISRKYFEVFCKTTKRFSAKLLRNFLWKYWTVCCKNTERFSAEILKGVWPIAEGGSTLWHKMNNLLVKTQGLHLFLFSRPKYDEHLFRVKSFINSLKHEKGDSEDSRNYKWQQRDLDPQPLSSWTLNHLAKLASLAK